MAVKDYNIDPRMFLVGMRHVPADKIVEAQALLKRWREVWPEADALLNKISTEKEPT